MSSFSELLAKYIRESGLSIGEIARRMEENGVKIDRSYISKLKNGLVNPPSEEITKALAEVTGGDTDKLLWAATMGKSHPAVQKSLMLIDDYLIKKGLELEKKYPLPENVNEMETDQYISGIPEYKEYYDLLIQELEKSEFFMKAFEAAKRSKTSKIKMDADLYNIGNRVKIPIIGTVTAGPNGIAYEEHLGYEWTEEDDVKGGKYFYLQVKGDSMIGDGILPGDLALVMETPEVNSGDLAVAIVNGEEGTIKRIYKKDDSIILQSSNPSYPPRFFTGKELEDIRIVGKVKQTIRKY